MSEKAKIVIGESAMDIKAVDGTVYRTIEVKDYAKLKAQVESIADTYKSPLIQTEEDRKAVKKERAEINKLAEAIDTRRKATVHDWTDTWQNQCKTLVKALKDCASSITEALDEYEGKTGEEKAKMPTFSVSPSTPEECERLRKYLIRTKLKFSVK